MDYLSEPLGQISARSSTIETLRGRALAPLGAPLSGRKRGPHFGHCAWVLAAYSAPPGLFLTIPGGAGGSSLLPPKKKMLIGEKLSATPRPPPQSTLFKMGVDRAREGGLGLKICCWLAPGFQNLLQGWTPSLPPPPSGVPSVLSKALRTATMQKGGAT